MPDVIAYTDGACSGNPGPGGWGVLLEAYDGDRLLKTRELCGGARNTTNNRMELTAVISALDALTKPSAITVITDSAYVKNGITSWIHGWKDNGWITSSKKPVKNVELWRALDDAQSRNQVTWKWIKGHAGHAGNERADELARQGMKPFMPKRSDKDQRTKATGDRKPTEADCGLAKRKPKHRAVSVRGGTRNRRKPA